MARHKIPDAPAYRSWEDVNTALRRIGELEANLDTLEIEQTQQIAGVKALYQAQAKSLQEQIKGIKYDLKAYTTAHREEIKGQSKQLPYGSIGFRRSSHVRLPAGKTALMGVVTALRARKMLDCIRITETPDKDALRKYPEAVIKDVGAELQHKDEWWCEVDRTKLIDMQ